jgi:hypothetical protein
MRKRPTPNCCKRGATAIEPVKDVGEGNKVAAVSDPFGNRLGTVEIPKFRRSEVR